MHAQMARMGVQPGCGVLTRCMWSCLLLSQVLLRLSGVGAADAPASLGSASFGNCIALSPKLQMHYTIEGDVMDMVLEGKLPDATTDSWYLSYGYSPEGARGSEMVGGSAILGGLVNGECFGYEYYLDGELECNYDLGYGSCPSYVFAADPAVASTASLVECEKVGDVLAIRMTKKLGVDEADIPGTAWPVDSSKYAMWAIGRVDAASTAEKPVALLHSSETPRLPGLKVALEEAQNSCTGSFGLVGKGGAGQGTDVSAVDGQAAQAPDMGMESAVGGSVVDGTAVGGAAMGENSTSACTMEVDGISQTFQTCSMVRRTGTDFQLMWNLTADPTNPESTIMTMGMRAVMPGQYVAVGFPSKPKSMINAATMIMANSDAGTSLRQYYMDGYDVKDVYPSQKGMNLLTVTEPNGLSANGEVSGMFTMSLPYPYPGDAAAGTNGNNKRRSLLQADGAYNGPLASYPMIFAAGDVNSDGTLRRHFDDGASNMNLAYAVFADGQAIASNVTTVDNESIKVAHQVIMAIGWGVMIPLGIVGGRAKMQLTAPKWYNVHRYLQSIGYLIGLIGVGLGFGITKSWDTLYPVHRDLGITITVLATVQVASLLWKPAPGTTLRKYWGPWHIYLGRATVILAIANIYYGMLGMGEYNVETWAWAVYTAALACIILLGIYSEYREYVLRREAREHDDPEKGKASPAQTSRAASIDKASSIGKSMVDVDMSA